MKEEKFVEAVRQKLKGDLLGYTAQKIMEPPMRGTFELDSSNAKKAATLLILYYDVEWRFILIQRSSHPLDKHKGQISFPGGSKEEGEELETTAIREANEEIGVESNQLEILGKLSDLFIPVSNFIVAPYVAVGKIAINKLVKEDAEVAEILSIRLSDLLNEKNVQKREMKMANGMTIKDVPIFNIDNHEIWGATAMMLSEFKEIVRLIVK